MDSIDAEIADLIDRFRIADHHHTQALRRRQTYEHRTRTARRRGPRIGDTTLEQLCRREDRAWVACDELFNRVIETPARSVSAIAIKLRFALNHGRMHDEDESVEADTDVVLSALRDAERLAIRPR